MSDGYAGDVTPTEAWKLLNEDSAAVLVDVRTNAEWSYVGLPDLSTLGKQTVKVAWQVFPEMKVNPEFLDAVTAAGIKPESRVLLLCRSGVRSQAAARFLTQHGFKQAYNVSDGFEGPHDAAKHRGSVSGWKAAGLPWQQG
jgi:rhodanese-related sulfurtransferase